MSLQSPLTAGIGDVLTKKVLLLTMGQQAYFGPVQGSLPHFAELGYFPRGMMNPAEYLLEVSRETHQKVSKRFN